MLYFTVACFLTAFINLTLGFFSFLKGKKAGKIFFLLCFSVAVWSLFMGLEVISTVQSIGFLFSKLLHAGVIFIPVTYLHFSTSFLKITHKKRRIIITGYILACIMLILDAFGLVVRGVSKKYYFNYFTDPGLFYPVLLLMFFSLVAYAVYLLIKAYPASSSLQKKQIKYDLVATAIGFTGGSCTFLPVYNIFPLSFGMFFVPIYPIVVYYAIIAYRFMDIEVIIKKTLVFAGLFSFMFGIFAAVVMFISTFIVPFSRNSLYLSSVISIVIILLVHDPFKNFLINVTNKYLFQKKYSPRKILKDFADEALTILNLDKLCKVTIDTLVNNLYLTNCAVLLLTYEEIGYGIYDSFGIEDKKIHFNAENVLVRHLKSSRLPLLYQSYDESLQASDEAKSQMGMIKSHVCLPLMIRNELVGILSLGVKKSDQPYNADDIDILTTLTKTLSIAISNAKLFMQAAQNEKLAAIGTITSAINHEICRPLSAISGNMQLFTLELDRGSYNNHDELLKKVKNIMQDSEEQIRKAVNITSKLSGFAKPSNVVETKPIDIAQSVEDALILLKHKLELDKIKIEKNTPENLPKIIMDEDQMQQIFFNLIRNAAEAIKENGTIKITAKEDNEKIKIQIQDTGCGITEDKLDEIFKPFYTTKGETKGSGYGLAIVRELVQRNNGNITVKSKAGEGTTFFLEFPKAKE